MHDDDAPTAPDTDHDDLIAKAGHIIAITNGPYSLDEIDTIVAALDEAERLRTDATVARAAARQLTLERNQAGSDAINLANALAAKTEEATTYLAEAAAHLETIAELTAARDALLTDLTDVRRLAERLADDLEGARNNAVAVTRRLAAWLTLATFAGHDKLTTNSDQRDHLAAVADIIAELARRGEATKILERLRSIEDTERARDDALGQVIGIAHRAAARSASGPIPTDRLYNLDRRGGRPIW